jgi:pimeloyl-ACP methyl ester carboxylesterase
VDDGWLERDGVRLHYLEWRSGGNAGAPAPPVLLLHGLSSNARVWERVAQRLPGLRLVALDQRSHGLSDRPDTGYALDDVVADAAHAVRELGLGRPLVAGHSWGAEVALAFAAGHPDLASGVAIVDGPTASFSRFMTWEEAEVRMQPPLPTYSNLAEAEAEQRRYIGEAWADDLGEFVRAGLVDTPDGGLAPTLTAPVRLQILRHLYAFQPELLFADVQGPVLIALAAQLWPGAPTEFVERRRRSAEEVVELRPDARLRWYDSRHDIPLIRPTELAGDLERTALAAGFGIVATEAAAVAGRAGLDWARPAQADVDGWSAHDLLSHLASAQASLAGMVSAPPRAADAPAFDPDRWNAGQVRRRAEATPAALAQEMRRGTEHLHAALMDVDLEATTGAGRYAGQPVRAAIAHLLEHQQTHLEELKTALAA